jgi:D-amino-acid dehydrogenase
MLCRSERGLEEEAELAEQAAEIGVEARVLDAGETSALDPEVRMDVAGSVYFPQDCHLDPGRFLAGLRERIARGRW